MDRILQEAAVKPFTLFAYKISVDLNFQKPAVKKFKHVFK